MAVDLSTLIGTEQIKQIDKKTAKRYRVVEETIDLEALRRELEELEKMEEPTKEELIELGRAYHPYYLDREERIAWLRQKINEVLSK